MWVRRQVRLADFSWVGADRPTTRKQAKKKKESRRKKEKKISTNAAAAVALAFPTLFSFLPTVHNNFFFFFLLGANSNFSIKQLMVSHFLLLNPIIVITNRVFSSDCFSISVFIHGVFCLIFQNFFFIELILILILIFSMKGGFTTDHDCGGGGGNEDDDNKWPLWLRPLLQTSFFGQCKLHATAHKSECNMYCLDCMNGALCSLCLSYHKDHRSIQVCLFLSPFRRHSPALDIK